MKNSFLSLASFLITALFFFACNNSENKPESTNTDSAQTKMTTTEKNNNSTSNQDMDAVKVAPDFYKVVADTLGIRIVEVNYKPGDSSALHWHPDYAIYVVQGGKVTFYAKDGTKTESDLPTGATLIKAGEMHSAKNTGKNPIKVILVETNRKGQTSSPDSKMDAAKVSPNLYKVKNDTLGLRILSVHYKPGETSGLHSHPDAALYVIDAGTGEFTGKDGSKRTLNLQKGMTIITPADTHTVKNVGKTTMNAILVEVYKGQ